MYEAYGILFSLGTRVLNGEAQLSEQHKERVRSLKDGVDEVTVLIGDLEVDKPVTWARFGSRVVDRLFGIETTESIDQRLVRERCEHYEWQLGSLWTEVFLRAERSVVLTDEDDELWEVRLPNGTKYFVEAEKGSLGSSAYERRETAFNPNLPDDRQARQRVMEGVAQLFWADRAAVMLDSSLRGESFCTLELEVPAYHGPLLDVIERWRSYQEVGVRRSVLIQGRPGTGKSTFALHAARVLSERTLILTAESCDALGDGAWYTLLRVLEPTMIILDDIDRLSEMRLERKLRMFEEGYCDVPFLVFTSNDYQRLPLPLRRPGRIDQILEVDEPNESIVMDVIRRIALREGVGVPEGTMSELLDLSRRLSMAHVVERLRRARVEGWDAIEIIGDITFTRGYDDEEDDDDDSQAAAE